MHIHEFVVWTEKSIDQLLVNQSVYFGDSKHKANHNITVNQGRLQGTNAYISLTLDLQI